MTAAPEPEQADFDPLADDFVADPNATWARLRSECPVARGARWDFWALTRYDDIVAASSRPADFTSSLGIVVPKNPVSGRRAPLHFDPPEHPRYRRPLNRVFAEERVPALEPRMRELAAELLDPFVAAGGGEFVSEFSSPYAGLVFTDILHLPRDYARELNASGERFEHAQAHFDTETAERENQHLYAECRKLVAARRQSPLDAAEDIVSALLEVRIDGEPLEDEFVAGSIRQLLIAAHVAPTALVASAVDHLAREPELQARLRGEPALIPAALEELMRLYAPNQGFARTATRDVEVRGRTIREGEMAALVLPSANRDPEVFADAESFVLGRIPNPHLAFGHGPHKCAGIAIARAELRVALEELLARTSSFERAGEPEMLGWPVHGPETLPLACVAS
ncbi:MAG TPA: cytochrome P450 [Gaiellaceae bacterium]|jgi:cytochrome P450|nr:cytochrome P450 [Gaiellaceae bacterium]